MNPSKTNTTRHGITQEMIVHIKKPKLLLCGMHSLWNDKNRAFCVSVRESVCFCCVYTSCIKFIDCEGGQLYFLFLRPYYIKKEKKNKSHGSWNY